VICWIGGWELKGVEGQTAQKHEQRRLSGGQTTLKASPLSAKAFSRDEFEAKAIIRTKR
jgi:hypothetical protein